MDIDFSKMTPEEVEALIKSAQRFKTTGVTTTDPNITRFANDIKAFAASKNLEVRGVINAISFAVLGPGEKVVKGRKGQKAPIEAACREVGVKVSAGDSIADMKAKLAAAGYHYESGKAVKV